MSIQINTLHNNQNCNYSFEKSLFSVFSAEKDIFETFNVEYLKKLFKNGADVDETSVDGVNFLQKCILEEFSLHGPEKEEFSAILKLLIEKGIDLDHQDNFGCTCLHLAIEQEQFDLADFLFENGANHTTVDCDGKTAYDYALALNPKAHREEWEELLELLK